MKSQRLLLIKIRASFVCLEKHLEYSQAKVLRKLEYLAYDVNPSTFNKILSEENANAPKRVETLEPYELGMDEILLSELNMSFNEEQATYFKKPAFNWTPNYIPELTEDETKGKGDLVYNAAGRLPIKDKVELMQAAKKEVVEFGLRLKSFSEYFTSRNEEEFKIPIDTLLQKGVTVKAYLLDPTSNEARIYFDDRASVQREEKKSKEVIQESIIRLKEVMDEYEKSDYSGKFEVFIYKHIPYNHFLIVDGDTRQGAMVVSHYIYGVRRAHCPTIQFSKAQNPSLFKRYWKSYQALAETAIPLQGWLDKYKHL